MPRREHRESRHCRVKEIHPPQVDSRPFSSTPYLNPRPPPPPPARPPPPPPSSSNGVLSARNGAPDAPRRGLVVHGHWSHAGRL
eukprot:6441736-Prymnesium_polylepis.1